MTTYTFNAWRIDLIPGSSTAVSTQTEQISYTTERSGSTVSIPLKYTVTSSNSPTEMDRIEWEPHQYSRTEFSDGAPIGNMEIFLSQVDWDDSGTLRSTTVVIYKNVIAQDLYIIDLAGDPLPGFTTAAGFDTWFASIIAYPSANGAFAAGENIDPLGSDNLGFTEDDILYGQTDSDNLRASIGHDTLYGYGGCDVLIGGAGNDILWGGADDDNLSGGTGTNKLYGGTGRSDAATYYEHEAPITVTLAFGRGVTGSAIGGGANDTLYSIEDAHGSEFDDTLTGASNNNLLWGRGGNDILIGMAGADTLHGGDGNDLLFGGTGKDFLGGDDGNDTLIGGNGDDYLFGGQGKDSIQAGSGEDLIRAGSNADNVSGGNDADEIYGENGADVLKGDKGQDYLKGGNGDDELKGGLGGDTLIGDGGEDILKGGIGNDSLTGGADADTFVYKDSGSDGADTIEDFETGVDTVDLLTFGFASFAQIEALANDTTDGVLIDFGTGNTILMIDYFKADMLALDFTF